MTEREITAPAAIALPDGSLARDAVGWTRRPLHRCNLPGANGRRKRWEYWCVATRERLVSVTLADLDYIGLAAISFVDGARFVDAWHVRPLGLGVAMGDEPRTRDVEVHGRGFAVAIRERPEATHVEGTWRPRSGEGLRVELTVDRADVDSLGVLVPWSARRYQYTCKQLALPARGVVREGAREHVLDAAGGAFATLDYGRGMWPRRTTWNWACGAGQRDGVRFGFNLGARWTDASPVTENAFVHDGRLHKIGARVRFDLEAGTVRSIGGDQVDLRLAPSAQRTVGADAWPLGARLRWACGVFRGTLRADDGTCLVVDEACGWAEDLRARW
ncbi:MAG TPA: DUF2804 domain-containing protein [Polyangiaceae bacterium]|jgi:hypothetical protein